jgi:hypothetical protein
VFAAPSPIQRETWSEPGGRYFVSGSTEQQAIRDRALHALEEVGYRGFGDVTVISDGAEILKRLPRAMPKPTTHIIGWFHIAMKIQPMQQIADHIAQSQPACDEALSTIEDIRAVKWRLWHGRVICDLRHGAAWCKYWLLPPAAGRDHWLRDSPKDG